MTEQFLYPPLDYAKILGQKKAWITNKNSLPNGYRVSVESRGESAFVLEGSNNYLAIVQEGLGTKNRVVQSVNKSLYGSAWDTVAMIVNDLITSGAHPLVINAHWAIGRSSWMTKERAKQLAIGWKDACNKSLAVYGAGETPALSTIVYPDTIELSGSGMGIISPKTNYIYRRHIQNGDHIVLIESSGIHANGITKIREDVIPKLPDGYNTRLSTGLTLGDSLLKPTFIYAKLQNVLLEEDIEIHRMENITGHGWRKLMRSKKDFTYRINIVPPPQEEFRLIQNTAGISDKEMYSTFNMGVGFAIYVPGKNVVKLQKLVLKEGFRSWDAGLVEKGSRQVIIEPKKIVYDRETLSIR
jgi:phosphoribosylformylglycinamidine cyclo-ligase